MASLQNNFSSAVSSDIVFYQGIEKGLNHRNFEITQNFCGREKYIILKQLQFVPLPSQFLLF